MLIFSFEYYEFINFDENVKEIIHTENDVPEAIDYERIDKIVKSVYDFVSSYIFN